MMRRIRVGAQWIGLGDVVWKVYGLGRWWIEGRFANCVSRNCLIERVRRIIKAPKRPPRRIYEIADSMLGYLIGMASDFDADSYEIAIGLNIGAADAHDCAPATRLARERRDCKSNDGGEFPKLFLRARLSYEVYYCPDSGDSCEGWWAEVIAVYNVPREYVSVEWSRYMGHDIDAVDKHAIRRAAYKALRHVYNAQ